MGFMAMFAKKEFFILPIWNNICKFVAYNINAGSDTLYTCVTELTFKRHVLPSHTGAAFGRLFY